VPTGFTGKRYEFGDRAALSDKMWTTPNNKAFGFESRDTEGSGVSTV
jgi:hypothetical protein